MHSVTHHPDSKKKISPSPCKINIYPSHFTPNTNIIKGPIHTINGWKTIKSITLYSVYSRFPPVIFPPHRPARTRKPGSLRSLTSTRVTGSRSRRGSTSARRSSNPFGEYPLPAYSFTSVFVYLRCLLWGRLSKRQGWMGKGIGCIYLAYHWFWFRNCIGVSGKFL